MTSRKLMTVSVPPGLESAVKNLASRQHRTVPELVRHALRQYLGSAEREAAFERTMAYGKTRGRALGLNTEAKFQAILDELRHGRDSSLHAGQAARRR